MHTEFSFAVLISCLAVNVVFHSKGRAWMHGREKQNAMHTIRATQVKTTVNRESEKKKKRQRKPRFLSYKTRGSTRSQRKSSSLKSISISPSSSSSQPQRIPSRLRVPANPLATGHVLLVLLLGRPLVLVFDHILHVLCGLAGWLSDLGGDVAHGGPEDCFQASAYGVANGVEEAC